MFSYNEEKLKKIEAKHIFWPDAYGLVSEAIIGMLALIVFNTSELSSQLIDKNFDTADPFSIWRQLFEKLLASLEKRYIFEQVLIFALWAIVGALIYILIFRAIQIIFDVKHSLNEGAEYVRQDHAHGAFRWLASLHDFFLKALIVILGVAALLVGALVCFSIASQELNNGLAEAFPVNLGSLLLALLGAVVSVRLIVLGISLLSRRFRNWYTT